MLGDVTEFSRNAGGIEMFSGDKPRVTHRTPDPARALARHANPARRAPHPACARNLCRPRRAPTGPHVTSPADDTRPRTTRSLRRPPLLAGAIRDMILYLIGHKTCQSLIDSCYRALSAAYLLVSDTGMSELLRKRDLDFRA